MPPLPHLLFLIGCGALVAWLLVFAGVLVVTRPRTVAPGPPAEPLDSPRPAVVNLLTHGWRCTADAVAATLVDLLARGVLQARRDDTDPTGVLVGVADHTAANLTRYERRLLGRLAGAGDGDQVGLSAVRFGSRRAAARWFSRFAAEVAADARARHVARTGVNTDFLAGTTLLPAASLAGWAYLTVPTDRAVSAAAVAIAVVLLLYRVAASARERHRPTPAGEAAAAYWLGVRDHLSRHRPGYAAVPLDSPVLADRDAPYAVALGLAPSLSRQLGFTFPGGHAPPGNRKFRVPRPWPTDPLRLVWGWGPAGCAAAGAVALLGAAVVAAAVRWNGGHLPTPVGAAGWLVVVGLLVGGVGMLTLAAADGAGTRQRSGTVVRLEPAAGPVGRSLLTLAQDTGDTAILVLPAGRWDDLAPGIAVTVQIRGLTGLVSGLAVTGRTGSGPDTDAAPTGTR